MEDGFPEFAQSIINQILPHYLRPIPSATLVQFTPKNTLTGVLKVKKGTYIDSKPVDGITCRFQTCQDIDVLPMQLDNVDVESTSGGRSTINLDISLQSIYLKDLKTGSLRFYIGGDFSGAADLYLLLARYLDKVEILGDRAGESAVLPYGSLQPASISQSDGIIPFPTNSFPAYRLIQEYFLMKERFLSFELRNLDALAGRGSSSKFRIRFYLKDSPIKLPRVDRDRFLLHTTPAVNLFQSDAEPIQWDNRNNEVRIKSSKNQNGKLQVYSIDRVSGRARGASSRTDYLPMGMSYSKGVEAPVYQITFKPSQDGVMEPYMMISYPEGMEINSSETLTVQLTCSNGDLPTALRPGDISKPSSNTSELTEFKNILPPTEHLEPPAGGAMLWRMLSHLSLNYLPIADSENLRALLDLYVFSGADKKNELENRRRISGIKDVIVKSSDRLVRGAIMRGQEIEIVIDPDHFSSHGDLFIFGTLLDRLFASFASLNFYTALSIKDINTGERYEWPASLGERPLI